jgi:hypothetical protein
MVGVHVVLPDGGQLSLDGKGRLLHLCSIHLTLHQREWKSVKERFVFALSILTLLYCIYQGSIGNLAGSKTDSFISFYCEKSENK